MRNWISIIRNFSKFWVHIWGLLSCTCHLSALARSLFVSLRFRYIALISFIAYTLARQPNDDMVRCCKVSPLNLEFVHVHEIKVLPCLFSKLGEWTRVYFLLWNTFCTGNGKGRRRPNEHYYLYFLADSLSASCFLSLGLPCMTSTEFWDFLIPSPS